MRLNPPLTILALVGVCLAGLTVKREADLIEQARIRRAQCDVALTHLKNFHLENVKFLQKMPMLLHEEPEEAFSIKQIKLANEQMSSEQTDLQFESELKKSKIPKPSAVKLCPNIRKWAAQNRVRIEPEKPKNKVTAKPDWLTTNNAGQYDWSIVRISMPEITADGKYAYLNEGEYFGPLAGGGTALKYQKSSDGTWILVERMLVYVS